MSTPLSLSPARSGTRLLASAALSSVSNGAKPLSRLQGLPQHLKAGIRQQVKEEPLLFWIGLMGVPAAFLTPSTTYQDLKRRPEINPQERHLLVTQEIIRQSISALTHFITYYGSILLIGLKLKEGTRYKSLKQLLGATIVTTIGNGIIRPLITNEFLAKHAKHRQTAPSETLPVKKQAFTPFTAPKRALPILQAAPIGQAQTQAD